MTGSSITIELDAVTALRSIAGLQKLVANPAPMLRAIGVGLASNTRDRFNEAKDPEGNPWAPLLPAYAAIKKGPGILRGAQNMSGGLQGSITSFADGSRVIVGTNKIYGAIHQFGGTIRPKKPGGRLVFRLASGVVFAQSVTIPARPFLGLSAIDRDTILDVADVYMEAALAGRSLG